MAHVPRTLQVCGPGVSQPVTEKESLPLQVDIGADDVSFFFGTREILFVKNGPTIDTRPARTATSAIGPKMAEVLYAGGIVSRIRETSDACPCR